MLLGYHLRLYFFVAQLRCKKHVERWWTFKIPARFCWGTIQLGATTVGTAGFSTIRSIIKRQKPVVGTTVGRKGFWIFCSFPSCSYLLIDSGGVSSLDLSLSFLPCKTEARWWNIKSTNVGVSVWISEETLNEHGDPIGSMGLVYLYSYIYTWLIFMVSVGKNRYHTWILWRLVNLLC